MSPAERHDQMLNSAVGVGLILACLPMWWWDYHFPQWLVVLVNPILIAAVSYAIARWKRSLFGWLMFWAQIGIQVSGAVVALFTGRFFQPGSALGGLAILATVVYLVRVPRIAPAALTEVSHVVHHHVLHGLPDGFDTTALPGAVSAPQRRPLPAPVRLAIGAPKSRLAGLGSALRQKVAR